VPCARATIQISVRPSLVSYPGLRAGPFAVALAEVFFDFVLCCGGAFATSFTARSKRSHASGSNSIFFGRFVMKQKVHQPKITVTKTDAAQRQLRTAIRLWFTGGDPVAIHTLAAAAHEIIHRLFKLKGLHGLMFDTDIIKDEYRSDWAKLIKAPASFFKHADRYPNSTFEFNPEANWGLLMAGVHGLHRMGEPRGLEESAFMYWMRIERPHLFRPKEVSGDRIPIDPFDQLRGVPLDQFFQAFEAIWRKRNMPSGRHLLTM
jgi:hypothetical protein